MEGIIFLGGGAFEQVYPVYLEGGTLRGGGEFQLEGVQEQGRIAPWRRGSASDGGGAFGQEQGEASEGTITTFAGGGLLQMERVKHQRVLLLLEEGSALDGGGACEGWAGCLMCKCNTIRC